MEINPNGVVAKTVQLACWREQNLIQFKCPARKAVKPSLPQFLLTPLLFLGVWLGTTEVQAVGAVAAWGDNANGQTNVPVAAQSRVTAIVAGLNYTVALRVDGSVVAWGRIWNGTGYVPVSVPSGLSGVTAIAAGLGHTVVLKNNGTVEAWGYNINNWGATIVPAGLSGVTAISAGAYHTVALKSDGTLVAWGFNEYGQTTVPVEAQTGVIAVAAGYVHTVALKSDGTVVSWGIDVGGQAAPPVVLVGAGSGVTAISAGYIHTLALKNDGTVLAWGRNVNGQTTIPPGLNDVMAISAGNEYSLALKNDGTVIGWGASDHGQTTVPADLSAVSAISAGGYHTVVLIGDPLRLPFPPQKIFLAFGEPSSFNLLIVPNPFVNDRPFVQVIPGSRPAATVSAPYRNNVTSQIKAIYARSGVQNIEWTTSDSDDAVAVYFCPTMNPNLLGYSKGWVDRSNRRRRGEVIVFFVNELLPNLDAETAAHEIGHALGLRHVDPTVLLDPSNNEVMDSDVSQSPEFINAVSDVTDITSFSTHNPLYHLLRYVDGWSPAQLQNAGINPGTWDNGSFISARFSFQNENLRLYNITVFASGGNTQSSFALEEIPSATLGELSQRSFTVPEGLGIVLLASSTTNGLPDVISSTGDAFSVTNQVISPTGTNAFSLFRQDSPTNAVVVSTATAEFDAQSPHCNTSVSAPGVLRLDFRGTLQTSTTLTNWTDVGVVSPHFIVVGSTNTAGFFRSRQ